MSESTLATPEIIASWADDANSVVALCLRQKLLPVEGSERAVVFPPTYAEIGYNIDTLPDGTQVATVDSVGSQANRMEPIFLREPYNSLVPKVEIDYGGSRPLSLLEAGHRLGDAVVRASDLKADARQAFENFLAGDATALARLSPTSLVFGVWDSRDTQAKLPRIVQATIRAWDVAPLTRDAQFNPALNYAALQLFTEEEQQAAEGSGGKDPKAQRGFVHVPATDAPGGVVVQGPIERQVTVNLVALRRLDGGNSTAALRRYVLGVALAAATGPFDGFLRQGCFLTPDPVSQDGWQMVNRDGTRLALNMTAEQALHYAEAATKEFGKGPDRQSKFNKDGARADLDEAGKKKKTPKAKV